MSQSRLLVLSIVLIGLSIVACSSPEAPTPPESQHVVSHDRELVTTDPSQGIADYPRWVVFPSEGTEYRQVELRITYACPDSLHCGEWDYIDNVFLGRVGGADGDSLGIEIARTISPYGWRFDSTWSFTWHVDVTDFALLLHDSVEVIFRHGGYEADDDRGWLVTLDFAIQEGRPAMRCLGWDTLWSGSIRYGDADQPIEEALHPIEFSHDSAEIARLRIHQTGHGMDDSANCAEFCQKWRRVIFDDSVINERVLWRECGDNPVYPQAGTWIFDRANWCPGCVVYPDIYDLPVTPGRTHTIDIEMEPYTNPNEPSANWALASFLFFYEAPWAAHDVTLEEIIIPSTADEYSRLNPACAGPRVVIKNSGAETLAAATIGYGVGGLGETYDWTGALASMQADTIDLPGVIRSGGKDATFYVGVTLPEATPDEFPGDNVLTSTVTAPPVHGSPMVLAVRTNHQAEETSYRITTGGGTPVLTRALGTLAPDAIFYDTLDLDSGCYQLLVSDTGGDGLRFWFNTDGGHGSVRLSTPDGHLIENFNPDFGSEIRYWFTVEAEAENVLSDDPMPLVDIFPPRNEGEFDLYVFQNEAKTITVEVVSDSTGAIVLRKMFRKVKDDVFPLSLGVPDNGIYSVRVIAQPDTTTVRMRLKK